LGQLQDNLLWYTTVQMEKRAPDDVADLVQVTRNLDTFLKKNRKFLSPGLLACILAYTSAEIMKNQWRESEHEESIRSILVNSINICFLNKRSHTENI